MTYFIGIVWLLTVLAAIYFTWKYKDKVIAEYKEALTKLGQEKEELKTKIAEKLKEV